MKSVERLAERIKREHNVAIDVRTFERTRAGYWQRAAGAWSWFALTIERHEIGSQFSVRQLLKSKKLEVSPNRFNQIEVDPAEPCSTLSFGA